MKSINNTNLIKKCSFVNCKSLCLNIDGISNVVISDNVFYQAVSKHTRALNIKNFTFTNNLMIGATARTTIDVT